MKLLTFWVYSHSLKITFGSFWHLKYLISHKANSDFPISYWKYSRLLTLVSACDMHRYTGILVLWEQNSNKRHVIVAIKENICSKMIINCQSERFKTVLQTGALWCLQNGFMYGYWCANGILVSIFCSVFPSQFHSLSKVHVTTGNDLSLSNNCNELSQKLWETPWYHSYCQ